ncbi:unnamed protein product [Zymoseptoria tritici ST99CH_3D1]|nr:unnamed protein product [Zymoseptoria tritici ST99CH_3D1]
MVEADLRKREDDLKREKDLLQRREEQFVRTKTQYDLRLDLLVDLVLEGGPATSSREWSGWRNAEEFARHLNEQRAADEAVAPSGSGLFLPLQEARNKIGTEGESKAATMAEAIVKLLVANLGVSTVPVQALSEDMQTTLRAKIEAHTGKVGMDSWKEGCLVSKANKRDALVNRYDGTDKDGVHACSDCRRTGRRELRPVTRNGTGSDSVRTTPFNCDVLRSFGLPSHLLPRFFFTGTHSTFISRCGRTVRALVVGFFSSIPVIYLEVLPPVRPSFWFQFFQGIIRRAFRQANQSLGTFDFRGEAVLLATKRTKEIDITCGDDEWIHEHASPFRSHYLYFLQLPMSSAFRLPPSSAVGERSLRKDIATMNARFIFKTITSTTVSRYLILLRDARLHALLCSGDPKGEYAFDMLSLRTASLSTCGDEGLLSTPSFAGEESGDMLYSSSTGVVVVSASEEVFACFATFRIALLFASHATRAT